MCGIAGVGRASGRPVEPAMLARMAAAIRHRGPDGYGLLADRHAGLVHTRLSIIDLAGGHQPLANEDRTLWITYNGEIFNWQELQRELAARGHVFRTRTDSEVIVHGWEEWGTGLLERLNGQFAFALYDRRDASLVLARDRFGVRPLFYALPGGDLVFGSEAKALFASGEIDAAVDPEGLDAVFAFWGAPAPRTVFRDVHALEPGTWLRWSPSGVRRGAWWTPAWDEPAAEPAGALDELDALLRSSIDLRMRADVPVGAYLSGGLDSSIVCALARRSTPHVLRTFSVSFADPGLDESRAQEAVAQALGTDHAVQGIGRDEIVAVFPEVVRHAETPMLRTAPAPMYLLARLARSRGITVVLTGEGSDELFYGYDLFREAAVRRAVLRRPASARRALLFDRLYPWLAGARGAGDLWRRFFLEAGPADDPLFSHQVRLGIAGFARSFYGPALDGPRPDPAEALRARLPAAFGDWSPDARAAWIELTTLLEGYLLSTQGDRMALAHGVEARYPFLDHRLFAFAAHLPARSKRRGLREKAILRRWAEGVLPPAVRERPKQPYRAPDVPAFFDATGPGAEWVRELLSPAALRRTGLFDPGRVAGLERRCRAGRATSVREGQALAGILSGQLWHQAFLASRPPAPGLPLDRASVLAGEQLGTGRLRETGVT